MVNEDGTLKPDALKATARASGGAKTEDYGEGECDAKAAADKKEVDSFKEDKALDEAREKLEGVPGTAGDDDVD